MRKTWFRSYVSLSCLQILKGSTVDKFSHIKACTTMAIKHNLQKFNVYTEYAESLLGPLY